MDTRRRKRLSDERPPRPEPAGATTATIRLGDTDYRATIDRADVELLSGFFWKALQLPNGRVYAHTWHGKVYLAMHRFVLGAGTDELVDHQNGDGLDNRRLNLRIATPTQNNANRAKRAIRSAGSFTCEYKGVYWDKSRQKWAARIHSDGKARMLGRFTDPGEAARIYDAAALATWGEFARLNFP